MSNLITLTGMVLTSMPINDYDKRITILTLERGKITAFARGAKRPNSQLLAATNPFAFGKFELFEGKSAYNLSKASIDNYFREITTEPQISYTGFYFLEFAEYFCQENNDEKDMLSLLYMSLKALISGKFEAGLVRMVFELKAISINGMGPQVFSCITCRKKENLTYFSINKGGCLCKDCGPKINAGRLLNDSIYTIQFIISSPIKSLFSFRVSEEVLKELKGLMKDYLEYYVHHKFKSLQILEGIYL